MLFNSSCSLAFFTWIFYDLSTSVACMTSNSNAEKSSITSDLTTSLAGRASNGFTTCFCAAAIAAFTLYFSSKSIFFLLQRQLLKTQPLGHSEGQLLFRLLFDFHCRQKIQKVFENTTKL